MFSSSEPSVSLPFLKEEPARSSGAADLQQEVVELFEGLRTPLLRCVTSLGLTVQDGEDVVQEVFLALFRHLQSGKPRTNIKGWVFRVAYNLALKQRMRNGVRDRRSCEPDAADLHPANDPNPEEHMAASQRRQRLAAVINALPETDRCCLVMRAEGLRYREIAEALSISLGGVSLSLARSFARLARADKG